MKTYPLGQLLDVRVLREKKAQSMAANAKRTLERTEKQAVAKLRRHEDYHQWRQTHEAQLFAELTGKCVVLKELEKFKYSVHSMRIEEEGLKHEHTEAVKAVQDSQQELEKARKASLAASMAKLKLEHHQNGWQREETKRSKVKAEMEQEDVPCWRMLV